jgi:hypothetical protein
MYYLVSCIFFPKGLLTKKEAYTLYSLATIYFNFKIWGWKKGSCNHAAASLKVF